MFIVHEDMVCAKSKFFRAACSNNWKEGQEKLMQLPSIEPSTFQAYTEWVYSNSLLNVNQSTKSLVKLYLVADYLDDVRLRNKSMEALIAFFKRRDTMPSATSIQLIWENTTPSSRLRAWIVDVTAKYCNRESFAHCSDLLPSDFVLQIALKLMPEGPIRRDPTFLAKATEYLEVEEID